MMILCTLGLPIPYSSIIAQSFYSTDATIAGGKGATRLGIRLFALTAAIWNPAGASGPNGGRAVKGVNEFAAALSVILAALALLGTYRSWRKRELRRDDVLAWG